MSAKERDADTLRLLAAMPFLDRLELAAVSGMAERTAHNTLARLQEQGLADCIRHASALAASTPRWHVTAQGLHFLAGVEGSSLQRILRTQPVSAHWQRVLLARLDAVASVYRLAATLADAAGGLPCFLWYRANPLDAAMALPEGRTLGVIRHGPTVDRTAFADRVGLLLDPDRNRPRTLLALLPDETRLRQIRRLLARYPGPVYLATEENVACSLADDPIWHIPSGGAVLSLNQVLGHLRPGGLLPAEPPLSRVSPPGEIILQPDGENVAGHHLPLVLKPADKRMLDCLADWPWITAADLGGLLGLSPSGVSKVSTRLGKLGLVSTVLLDGRRLALGRRGLAFLARRDRVSVPTAVRRWSVETEGDTTPVNWRDVPGTRNRPLARTIEHTGAVHRFMAALARQAKRTPAYRVLEVSPPHQAARYFRHRGNLRSIHPDGFGVVQAGDKTCPFFLEWERRALHPSTMAARLAPYLRYYASNRPLDDYGHRPVVLIVFDDYLAEGNFLGVARREMERAGVNVPLWVSYQELLEKVGPLGKAWRNPEVLEPTLAFL